MAARHRVGFVIAIFAALALVAIGFVGIVARTDWGHEKVRRQLVSIIGGKTHGTVKIGRISGNLLTGATMDGVEILDSLGVPFLQVERVSARYSLRTLYSQRLVFDDVTLVRPVLLFDRPPGQKWNIARLWPSSKSSAPEDPAIHWGDVFALNNVRVIDGTIIVRAAWHPRDTLTKAQQDSVIERALGPKGRFVIVDAPGGHQRVSRFDALNGVFPTIRLFDPNENWMKVVVAEARVVAAPFRGPVAQVRDLKGTFEFEDDSAWFKDVRVRLRESRVVASGRYHPRGDNLEIRMTARPGAFTDFRWAYPDFPTEGGGPLDFTLKWWDGVDTYALKNFDVKVGRSQVAGNATIRLYNGPDTVVFADTDLRFRNFDTRLISRFPPGLVFPRAGAMTGRATVEGTMARLLVDADVAYHDDRTGGDSRISARGEVAIRGGFRARGLRVTMEPLEVALVREYAPRLPIGGTVRGTVVLDGGRRDGIAARGGVVHSDRTGRSSVTGRALVQPGGARRIYVDARLHPVSLATVGRFAPSVGLRGSASGRLAMRGTMRNLTLDTDLRLGGGGAFAARGTMNLAGAYPSYDLRTSMTTFNANAVIARAPRTSLTGEVFARGRGTDPATMNATFAGRLTGIRIDTLAADSAVFRVAIGGGLLRVDTLVADGPSVRALAVGSIGMREGRSGELRYDITIDSLQRFGPLLPKAVLDTTVVVVRPRSRAMRIAQARADSARVASATEVERAATGRPGPGPVRIAGAPKFRADSVAGWVRARGVLTGNIRRLSTRGTLEVKHLLLRGYAARRGLVDYTVVDLRSATATIDATARLDSVVARGFELDSVRAVVRYADPNGTANVTLYQPGGEVYAVNGGFVLHADHSEVHLVDMRLKFDTTLWTASRPATIRWGRSGIDVENFELRNGFGGRLYVNGTFPREGNASFDIQTTRFQIGDIAALLQSDLKITGVVDMNAHVEGTLEEPRFRGTLAVSDGTYGGSQFPDVRGTFGYALGVLTAQAEAMRKEGNPLLVASGRIPINLGVGRAGPLIPDAPMDVTINADSLPIDLIPSFVGVVANVKGAMRGDIRVRGSITSPRVEGAVTLADGEATIVPTGARLRNIVARVHLERDSLVIDSLSASAGRGWVAVKGGIDLSRLREPAFDLRIAADNARLLDNDRGQLSADAFIEVRGPFDAVVAVGSANIRNGMLYIPEPNRAEVLKRDDPALFAVVDTAVRRDIELIPTESPLFANLVVDVALTVQRDTWVRSREANIEVYGDLALRMDRSKEALALEGSISTDRGEYSIFSKRFQVRQGTATFLALPAQGLNPILQITAEYEIREPTREAIVIRLIIGGTLENPRLALASNAQPPIPQGDLLSYLAFGRSSGSLLQLGGSGLAGASAGGGLGGTPLMIAATQTLSGMAIGMLADEIEGEASRAMRLDMFNIQPSSQFLTDLRSPRGFLENTQIEFGKYINPRTFVSMQTLLKFDPRETPIGVRVQSRARRGIRFEGSFEPRINLPEPSLEPPTRSAFGAFGAYVIREWRF